MAYFIVIGTGNDVRCVVDEVKNAHLQHNVVTSGCVLKEEDVFYYHWDVFNQYGEKTKENKEVIALHDALTNQISQFRTLLPNNAIPNVFIVAKCFNEEESRTLQMVCDELYQIGGARLSGLQVDIILLGYNLNKPEYVTIRPHWKILKSISGLGVGARFNTKVLYVNNMNYMGAATNVDSHILSRFISHWSKIVCSGGFYNVNSHFYSIGMSEHQYDFRDLNEFFKISAEERLLDRTLNNAPSSDTQELIDANYFKKIDLDIPWLDGLCQIQSLWKQYCTTQWNPSLSLCEHDYSISQQEMKIAAYLNSFLKLYISEKQREMANLNDEVAQKGFKKSECAEKLIKLNELPADDETRDAQINSVNERIAQLDSEIENCKRKIQQHEENIATNTFLDADAFHEKFCTMSLLTEEDEAAYATNKTKVEQLLDYVKSKAGIKIMREAIEKATTEDVLPDSFPESEILNMGRVKAISLTKASEPLLVQPAVGMQTTEKLKERSGCLLWIKNLFGRNKTGEGGVENAPLEPVQSDIPQPITLETNKFLNDALGKSVAAVKKADDVRKWWNRLCDIIDKNQKRQTECKLLMDGEKDQNGEYISGKEGYRPKEHQKSTSLIDMNRVRQFRDSDSYYKQNIEKFLERWFDKAIESDKRMTMLELIKHQVLDPFVGRFHTLKWDGSNPFVKEDITDEEMHDYIEHNLRQSKPSVEYVRIQETSIVSSLSIGFFSNNPNIPTDPTKFKNKYNISTVALTPVFLDDFVNSLCVVQIIDIPNHIDALKDFKPSRDASLAKLRLDISTEATTIIGEANTIEEKARAIYNWICENIEYDTTKQIHDAETCYKTRRGVCQAYCELFCYLAEAVGLTVDVITGITKDADGNVSEERHSWVFVYTHAYDGILIDPTWGAGTVNGVKYVKNDDNSTWFNVSPYLMIFSHFPDLQDWTKLDITITEEQFRKLPMVQKANEDDCMDILFQSVANFEDCN